MNGKAAIVVAMYSRIRTFLSILITPFTLESSPFHLADRYFRSAPKLASILVDFSYAKFSMLVGADSQPRSEQEFGGEKEEGRDVGGRSVIRISDEAVEHGSLSVRLA